MGFDLSVDELIQRWREVNTPRNGLNGHDDERMMDELTGFILPSEKTPVAIATILEQINLDFLGPVLLKSYTRKPTYHPLTMLRAIMLQVKRGLSQRGIRRHLIAHPDQALQLGFEEEFDRVKIPSRDHFRTFIQNRIDWDEVRDAIVLEFQPVAEANGIEFASQAAEDATMIKALKNDPDAVYNGHYKKTGLKEDIVTCVETGLPFLNEILGGTECEGHTLIRKLEHQRGLGMPIEDLWVDGTYATLENIAIAHAIYGTTLHYQVQEGWKKREDGTLENIKKVYQQQWNDPNFKPNTNLKEMMAFLARKGKDIIDQGRDLKETALSNGAWGNGKRGSRGRPKKEERSAQDHFFEGESVVKKGMKLIEPVGAYHRNIVMEKTEKNPKAMKKDKGNRQITESINNHLKHDLDIESTLRVKGKRKVHIHVTLGCVLLLLLGLHKVRHGVKTDLASLVGIE